MKSHLKNDAHDIRGQEYIEFAWDVFRTVGLKRNRRSKKQCLSLSPMLNTAYKGKWRICLTTLRL